MSSSATILATTPLLPWRPPSCHRPTACASSNVNFDRFNDAALNALAGFGSFELFVVLHLLIVELLLKLPMISLILCE